MAQTPKGNVALTRKDDFFDVNRMYSKSTTTASVLGERGVVDDGGGKVEIWRIKEFEKVLQEPSQYGNTLYIHIIPPLIYYR